MTQAQLAAAIKAALDGGSDVVINPAVAREQQADAMAAAFAQYVAARAITVTGVTPGSGTAPGTITG